MAGNDALVQKIVEIIKSHVNPKQGLANLSRNRNLTPAITEIIKRNSPEAARVVIYAPYEDVVRAIVRVVQNSVKLSPPVAAAAVAPMIVQQAPIKQTVTVIKAAPYEDVMRAIIYAIQRGIPIPKEVMKAASEKRPGFFEKLSIFFRPKNKMPVYGPNVGPKPPPPPPPPNPVIGFPVYPPPPPPKPNVPPPKPNVPPPKPNVPPPPERNYTKMTVRELIEALRKYPENRTAISEALRKAVEKELRDLQREYSRARRVRKLGDLLRLLPRNYTGRRNASSLVVNNVRDTRNNRDLSNLKTNLGNVPNENIRRAFEEQRRRFMRKKNEERGRTRRNTRPATVYKRFGESNNNYELRRRRAVLTGNTSRRVYGGGANELNELRRRRAVPGTGFGGNGGGAGGNGGRRRNEGSSAGNGGNGGGSLPPPLPENQRRAINTAGGVNKAMNMVVRVPGGATEIAKAAEALNETSGNVNMAIQIKGASPSAVAAVQNLGGPKNTVVVLEGLNTLSRKTPPKKGAKRRKTYRPRIAELNRVINAVKKQKLISIMAHNVTKTHNIHPNDEKLKKYYKKVLKANILRTPLSKIVRKAAAKKRVA